jgi:hypothetical protein
VLKIFKNGNDPEMKEYLKELRGWWTYKRIY